ncbi:PREDICTED: fibroin heavy chain-like [Drosophila arizonae]|uniref:Fibroin heavy chain-like n=1 Tax=Drosophila arizonae TaxID=7263 RepID=A0ABM1NYQ4_DROAR|nr:PREDICTED: fibroin heavy chain-like [Drosophila arizonae]
MLKPNFVFVLAVGCLIGAQLNCSAALPRGDRAPKVLVAEKKSADKTVMSLFGNKNQGHGLHTNDTVSKAKVVTQTPKVSLTTESNAQGPTTSPGTGPGTGTGVRPSQGGGGGGVLGFSEGKLNRDGIERQDDTAADDGDAAGGGDGAGAGAGAEASTAAGGAATGGAAAGGGNAVPPGAKISRNGLPRFIKDSKGNWVYNQWGVTYGIIGQDTRFVAGQTIQANKIDSNAQKNYYPDGPLSTVCASASTVYNVPIVRNWLVRKVYSYPIKSRPIWNELRMHIYKSGNSEECHDVAKFKTWREYQECAIRRNMRLDSIIPMYPIHQMGSGF